MLMRSKTLLFILLLSLFCKGYAQDTLYFKLSNPWNTVKSIDGKYIRKCVKENDYFHVWDYNKGNRLVTESFYSDTNFTRKLFCHKYFDESTGLLEQSRCYENGRLHGYFVSYKPNGDTLAYDVYENGGILRSWESEPRKDSLPIFTAVEQGAEFPGGSSAWRSYLARNLNVPDSLKNVKGKVSVSFIVNAKGEIESVQIVKSLHPVLDQQVVRVIENSPKWIPGKQNGKTIKSYIKQPITF